MTRRIRTLIVDDEPPARHRLRTLLDGETDIDVIAEAGDGQGAVDLILSERPDLVFLDIQIPEMSGIEVVEAIGLTEMPAVIFVTAFDEYAVRAFDLAAIDYLLKPFDQDRFAQALARARDQLQRPQIVADRLARMLESWESARETAARLPVKVRGRIHMVPLADVDYIMAAGAYVRLHVGPTSHLIRERISALEARLDPTRFARVHRSLIVSIERVRELEPLFRGEYVIWLQDGTRLVTGRTYRARVQKIFGLQTA